MASHIDWAAVRQRLGATEAVLTRSELTEAQREAIFARRAAALAQPPPAETPSDALEVLVFALDDERYAFPSAQVREVRLLDRLTPLPSTPAFVAGLINVRGRVLPVLDLRPLFGLRADRTAAQTVLLLSSHHGDVGVLATNRPTVHWLRQSELTELPDEALAGVHPDWIRGVTPELLVVLDAERVLSDPRLRVQDDTSARIS